MLFHSIFYNKSNIKLPDYYIKYSDEEKSRLRKCIKPPNYFGGSVQTIDLQTPRESNYSDLSLKCNIAEIKLKYRSLFFFRATQEWNRLPSDVRLIENSNQFRDNLLAYINVQAFSSEIEPD